MLVLHKCVKWSRTKDVFSLPYLKYNLIIFQEVITFHNSLNFVSYKFSLCSSKEKLQLNNFIELPIQYGKHCHRFPFLPFIRKIKNNCLNCNNIRFRIKFGFFFKKYLYFPELLTLLLRI